MFRVSLYAGIVEVWLMLAILCTVSSRQTAHNTPVNRLFGNSRSINDVVWRWCQRGHQRTSVANSSRETSSSEGAFEDMHISHSFLLRFAPFNRIWSHIVYYVARPWWNRVRFDSFYLLSCLVITIVKAMFSRSVNSTSYFFDTVGMLLNDIIIIIPLILFFRLLVLSTTACVISCLFSLALLGLD